MKVYRAHAAGLFLLSWEGRAGIRSESSSRQAERAPDPVNREAWVLILARGMLLANMRLEFLVCPGTHTKLRETQIYQPDSATPRRRVLSQAQ